MAETSVVGDFRVAHLRDELRPDPVRRAFRRQDLRLRIERARRRLDPLSNFITRSSSAALKPVPTSPA